MEGPAEKDLYLAARTGKLPLLERAVSGGANLDHDFGNGTALCHAVFRGHAELARALVRAGASTQVKDEHGRNLLARTVMEPQDNTHLEKMAALVRELAPEVVAILDAESSRLPEYDIDEILRTVPADRVVNHLHGLLKSHSGELREHEVRFLAAMEAKWQIPCNGFDGWFFNLAGGSALRYAVEGLETMGARKSADIVKRSMTVVADGELPEDGDAWAERVAALSAEEKSSLNQLFDEFLETGEELDTLAQAWLIANKELFRAAKK